ncbi:predicted protein [Nematostella vectensis]|uniref:PXA domain-containing protein n=1 Tax=Nematostella vectensis TaxID=45351 RepID=A7S0U9_NEMVE|nr:predicted protein [Nematostella vectensis]|eukprot:XP_001634670.1 predicted protein [Nematostella vectensis]
MERLDAQDLSRLKPTLAAGSVCVVLFSFQFFSEVSSDEICVDELRTSLRYITSVLLRRARKVDIPTLVTDRLIKEGLRHFDNYIKAKERVLSSDYKEDIQTAIMDELAPSMHCAICIPLVIALWVLASGIAAGFVLFSCFPRLPCLLLNIEPRIWVKYEDDDKLLTPQGCTICGNPHCQRHRLRKKGNSANRQIRISHSIIYTMDVSRTEAINATLTDKRRQNNFM